MNPLVILDGRGRLLAVSACNEKSRAKSLEQDELWILRSDNGRVLPWRGGGIRCGPFRRQGGEDVPWYEVEVKEEAEAGAAAGAPAPTPAEAREDRDALSGSSTDRSAPPGMPAVPVLTELADLIAERRRLMPEGSYTTHLFREGRSKIRKKTGEEAVELILAERREEIISETADLIYHAMILLESEGVRIEEVFAELRRRHRE